MPSCCFLSQETSSILSFFTQVYESVLANTKCILQLITLWWGVVILSRPSCYMYSSCGPLGSWRLPHKIDRMILRNFAKHPLKVPETCFMGVACIDFFTPPRGTNSFWKLVPVFLASYHKRYQNNPYSGYFWFKHSQCYATTNCNPSINIIPSLSLLPPSPPPPPPPQATFPHQLCSFYFLGFLCSCQFWILIGPQIKWWMLS